MTMRSALAEIDRGGVHACSSPGLARSPHTYRLRAAILLDGLSEGAPGGGVIQLSVPHFASLEYRVQSPIDGVCTYQGEHRFPGQFTPSRAWCCQAGTWREQWWKIRLVGFPSLERGVTGPRSY
jgi:hypothetical protein